MSMSLAEPGAHNAAFWTGVQEGGQQLNVAFVARDGAPWTTWVFGLGRWATPRALGPPRWAPSGASIAVGATRGRHLDLSPDDPSGADPIGITTELGLFAVGHDAGLTVCYVGGIGDLVSRGPESIGPRRLAPPGAHVVTAQQGHDQLTVLFVGWDERLYAAWVGRDGHWTGPQRVLPDGLDVEPGAPLAVAHQGERQLDVFYVDREGVLHVVWVVGKGHWQGPHPLSRPRWAPSAAHLAAAAQGSRQLDVFGVDVHGRPSVFWVVGSGKWQGPQPLGDRDLVARPGGALATTSTQVADQLDVLFIDVHGNLDVAWVEGLGEWRGPQQVGADGSAPAGAPVTTHTQSQGGVHQTDVFYTGDTRQVSWVTGAGEWQGPWAFPEP